MHVCTKSTTVFNPHKEDLFNTFDWEELIDSLQAEENFFFSSEDDMNPLTKLTNFNDVSISTFTSVVQDSISL